MQQDFIQSIWQRAAVASFSPQNEITALAGELEYAGLELHDMADGHEDADVADFSLSVAWLSCFWAPCPFVATGQGEHAMLEAAMFIILQMART